MDHLINLLKDFELRRVFRAHAKPCELKWDERGERPWNYEGLVWTCKKTTEALEEKVYSACYGTLNQYRRHVKFHFITTPIYMNKGYDPYEWTWNIFFVPESPFKIWVDKILEVLYVPGTTREQLFEFVKNYGWTYTPDLFKTLPFGTWSNFMYATRLFWEKSGETPVILRERYGYSYIEAFFFRTVMQNDLKNKELFFPSGHYGHWWIYPNEESFDRYIKGTPRIDPNTLFDEWIWGPHYNGLNHKYTKPMPQKEVQTAFEGLKVRTILDPILVKEHFYSHLGAA